MAVAVNKDRYGAMLTTLDILRSVFENRIISHRADVVSAPWSWLFLSYQAFTIK